MKTIFKSNKTLISIIVSLFIICFISANIIISLTTNKFSIDATDNQKYTLNNQNILLLKNIKGNINIDLYLSSNFLQYYPSSKNYLTYVGNILEKYSKISNRKITINIKDPKPFSATEKEAIENKITPISNSKDEYSSYFGAVFTNIYGEKEVIKYFPSYRMGYLEKDISSVIYRLINREKKNIAIFSDNITILGDNKNISEFSKVKAKPKWSFIKSLEKDYNLYKINDYTKEISSQFDALIVMNPKKFTLTLSYAIDQYILRGGSVLFFIDPYSESENDEKGYKALRKPQIADFLANYGIKFYNNMVISDNILAADKTIITRNNNTKNIKYPAWLNVDYTHINNSNIISRNFDKLKFATAGALETIPMKNILHSDLVITSNEAKLIKDSKILQNRDLYGKNQPSKQYTLATYSRGEFNSLFNQRPELSNKYKNFHLDKSFKEGKIIVIADSDMINDKFYTSGTIRNNQNKSIYELKLINNNLDLVENSIKVLTNNTSLIDLANKINTSKKQSVFNKINQIYKQKYVSIKEDLVTKIESDKEKYLALSDQYRLDEENMEIIKELSILSKEMDKNIEELKKIDYLISQEVNKRIQIIMSLNIIFFPILLTILIYLIKLLLERLKARKVRNDYQ